ncbi:MAG: (2Fe-2S) ferredoxin domain-containing protein [Sphingobacteriaceae bacterium]|nr:MAG: (2Fe-2S) ferredoxin domain-containing protein [Sphingobacteriaceae bacterium]
MGKFEVPDKVLYVCTGSKCAKRGGKDLYKLVSGLAKHTKTKVDLEVIRIECTDRCDWAPVCNLQPDNIWLKEYGKKEVLKLLESALEL